MAEKLKRNWMTTAMGIAIVATTIGRFLLTGDPMSYETLSAGLGLIAASDVK